MSKLRQIRNGIAKLIRQDTGVGTITREVKAENGRGKPEPTGVTTTHKAACRVIDQSGSASRAVQWVGGLAKDNPLVLLAFHDSDFVQGDVLEWRGRKYLVGVVSRPEIDGGATCTQAPLTEVKDG